MPQRRALGVRRAARSRTGLPSTSISPLDAAQHAEQRQQQLALALAVEAAEADDLALADRERDVRAAGRPSAGPSTSSTRRRRGGAVRAWAERRALIVAADHQLDDLVLGRACPWRRSRRGGRCGTPSSRRPAPRSRACGARCRGAPGPRSRSRCRTRDRPARRRPRSAPRSPRRGSGAAACGASALAISTICRRDSGRSLTGARGWMSSQPSRASSSLGAPPLRAAVDQAEPARRVGDADIVGDREVGHQRQLLEDADDAGARWPPPGSAKRDRLAVEPHLALVGLRRRPTMILISVDLPAPFSPSTAWIEPAPAGEVDLLQRPHAAIALGDAAQLQQRRRGRASSSAMPPPFSERSRRRWRAASAARPSGQSYFTFSALLPMISDAVMLTSQGGNSFAVKKLSVRFGPVVLAVLERRVVGDRDRHRDQLRHRRCPRAPRSPPSSRSRPGPATGRRTEPFRPLSLYCGDVLAEAVLALARHRHQRMLGVHQRAHRRRSSRPG